MANTIEHSDNLSYFLLVEFLNDTLPNGKQEIKRTFRELGIIDPRNFNDEVLSVHTYATLFRVLYNISYLNAANSEKLLSWLETSSFKDGLASGVPRGIAVANKFGERQNFDKWQFHDCGIIYYPKNPYLLCVMTRGNDPNKLINIIREISQKVYAEVDSRKQ